ncbi:D-alanyl-D-alanine carboxypeptidase family protein [uncultured Ruthenibacterium sp.]|uniref:D-alanyl-D-alanine carboxypeptidase family protein n=1 Tax=uncultured Ruthenibacterium sp. TaxID=1905347 RepID=UPI00349E585E
MKRKHRKRILFFLLLALFSLGTFGALYVHSTSLNIHADSRLEELDQLNLASPSFAILDRESGQILYARNDQKRAPASLTKLMTALVTIENVADLNATTALSSQAYAQLLAANAAMAGFFPDEDVSILDLLYGLLLPSGADAAEALSCFVCESEAEFVEKMNMRAQQAGLSHTHFANAWGNDAMGMYSTPSDIAILLNIVLENETLRTILSTSEYQATTAWAHPEGLYFSSTLLKSGQDLTLENGQILGGKTGYTPEAGLCLASFAQIHGKEFILVTMGAPGDHSTSPYHIQDTIAIYNAMGKLLAN